MSNIVCKSVRLCSVCRSDEHDKRKCDMCAMDMRYFVSKNDIRSLCVKSLKLKNIALKEQYSFKLVKEDCFRRIAHERAQHGDNPALLNIRLNSIKRTFKECKNHFINKKKDYEKCNDKLSKYIKKSNTNEKLLAKNVDAVLKKHSIPLELCNHIASFAYMAPVKN
jgi:hypothetical protein